MGNPLVPRIPGIPHQMDYQTQMCEAAAMYHERISLPIEKSRILCIDTPTY